MRFFRLHNARLFNGAPFLHRVSFAMADKHLVEELHPGKWTATGRAFTPLSGTLLSAEERDCLPEWSHKP
jgi:hypothetical protein